jgi:hypothetical protein
MESVDGGLILRTVVKTNQEKHTLVFVPKLSDDRIDPCGAVTELVKLVRQRHGNGEGIHLFMKYLERVPLFTYNLKSMLVETLRAAQIQRYTAYTYKHAAMKYLVEHNVSLDTINTAARYKKAIVGKFYSYVPSLRKMHELLAQAVTNNYKELPPPYETAIVKALPAPGPVSLEEKPQKLVRYWNINLPVFPGDRIANDNDLDVVEENGIQVIDLTVDRRNEQHQPFNPLVVHPSSVEESDLDSNCAVRSWSSSPDMSVVDSDPFK